MNIYADKIVKSASSSRAKKYNGQSPALKYIDYRKNALVQRKVQEAANNRSNTILSHSTPKVINHIHSSCSYPIQKEDIPEHRLDKGMQIHTEEEREAFEKKYNYGDGGSGEEALERNNMRNRDTYAEALDELSAHARWFETGDERCQFSKLGDYYNDALRFYMGPREKGHSIWVDFQHNLRTLLQDAFLMGYAINQDDIQELVAKASLAKTLMESDGLGSAGRSTMRR